MLAEELKQVNPDVRDWVLLGHRHLPWLHKSLVHWLLPPSPWEMKTWILGLPHASQMWRGCHTCRGKVVGFLQAEIGEGFVHGIEGWRRKLWQGLCATHNQNKGDGEGRDSFKQSSRPLITTCPLDGAQGQCWALKHCQRWCALTAGNSGRQPSP